MFLFFLPIPGTKNSNGSFSRSLTTGLIALAFWIRIGYFLRNAGQEFQADLCQDSWNVVLDLLLFPLPFFFITD